MPGIGRIAALTLIVAMGSAAQEQALREAARLDSEGKCEQAEAIYRRELAKGAASSALLNNAGNHYLVCGHPDRARQSFEALLKMSPAHQNANLQMARLSNERKEGAAALRYLSRVKADGPAVGLVHAEALHWAGKKKEAAAELASIQGQSKGDARVLFSLGLAAARMELFEIAEAAFAEVAAQVPGDFNVQFNLGRAAFSAGHHARAVFALAQARKLAPGNPEVLLRLAQAAEEAGFRGDAVEAYGEYLTLKPEDDKARLSRALLMALGAGNRGEGLDQLQAYVRRHPAAPDGHFALAQVSWDSRPEEALERLSQTIKLDAAFAPAYFGRAWLLQRMGRMEESLPDLEAAARLAPRNPRALDQLGVTYLALDRPVEAEKTLRAAVAAAPGDRSVLMHLGQALMALNREQEAQQFFAKFRRAADKHIRDPRQEPGMIALATMPAAEQARIQIARLRKEAAEHPSQPELQLRLAQLLLSEGMLDEARRAFLELESRTADAQIWWEAGTSLYDAGEYRQAAVFLRRAADAKPEARLHLAMALLFGAGPGEALDVLDQTPGPARRGDWHVLRARALAAAGKRDEAGKTIEAGLPEMSSDPRIASQAALLLISLERQAEALSPLERAITANPESADLALLRASVLGLLNRWQEADRFFKAMESRWPEWGDAYVAHGLMLESAGNAREARQKFEVALALDPRDAFARCGAAKLGGSGAEGLDCACRSHLRQFLLPACGRK